MGLTVLLSVIIIFANLVVDILYGVPRSAHAGGADLMVANPDRHPRTKGSSSERRDRPASGGPIRQTNLWKDAWRRYMRNKGAVVAGVVFVLLLLYCLFVPDLLAVRPERGQLREANQNPSLAHPFGTDKFGRDLFTRTALGGRVSIGIGFGATFAILVDRRRLRLDLGLRRRQARQRA